MRSPPELTKRQFTTALERNGFRQVLMWIQDTTGQCPGVSWGMVMWRGGKMAYRASLAKAIRERKAAVAKTPTVKDVKGNELRVGDTVRKVEWGPNAIHRLVEGIGEGETIAGYIKVTGSIAWEHPRNYEKI